MNPDRSRPGGAFAMNSIELDDIVCLQGLSGGSVEAFDKLYHRYAPLVERFGYSLLKDREDTADLCQNIFSKLWQNRESLSGVRSFKAYLFRMTKNAAFDMFESQKPESLRMEFNEELHIYTGDDAIPESIDKRDLFLLVRIVEESMPDQRRRVFHLSRRMGLANKEIAAQLGISTKTVEYHISRALADFRKIYGNEK